MYLFNNRSDPIRSVRVLVYLVIRSDLIMMGVLVINRSGPTGRVRSACAGWVVGALVVHTSVELLGRFLPRLCARKEAPTGSNAGLGLALIALNVADIAPWKIKMNTLHQSHYISASTCRQASVADGICGPAQDTTVASWTGLLLRVNFSPTLWLIEHGVTPNCSPSADTDSVIGQLEFST